MKKEIKTEKVATAPNILSQGIQIDGFVFLSGQIGVDLDWKLVEGDIQAEIKQTLENIKAILEEANLGLDDVVKVTLYVTDISRSKEINEVYSSYFTQPLPAREMIGVNELPLGASIEISIIAKA